MDGCGTTPRMEEVGLRLELQSRTASGTAVERSLQRIRHLLFYGAVAVCGAAAVSRA